MYYKIAQVKTDFSDDEAVEAWVLSKSGADLEVPPALSFCITDFFAKFFASRNFLC
jgi:hypothetical protein